MRRTQSNYSTNTDGLPSRGVDPSIRSCEPLRDAVEDLRSRAGAAAALAKSLQAIVAELEKSGLRDDARCADAFRAIDPEQIFSLPDGDAIDALQRLHLAILTLEAWKLAR